MPVPALMETTVGEVHAAFRSGTVTCRQLVQFYLDRIAAYEDAGPKLNAITNINPNALVTAAELDARWKTSGPVGPLHGIPVLLKDNIDTADMPTTSGSRLLKDWVPARDATITRSLRAAGAVILGKASMGELAAGNYNSIDGQQINPYHFKRTTGGSSSGSAAAVTANLTLLAIGTDTYTSVRGPAAFNGIVGLRPTTGLISRAGIAPRENLIDTAGPMARSVVDLAKLLTVLAGPDPRDPLSVEIFANSPAHGRSGDRYGDYTRHLRIGALRGARVGVVQDFFGGDPEIDDLARDAVKSLKSLGSDIASVQLDTDFYERYVLHGLENLVMVLEYGFRQEWETYLATLAPDTPKTIAEWVRIYRTEGPVWPFPPAPGGVNAIEVLQSSLDHSKEDPQFRHLVQEILPELTRRKLELFQRHAVDALVFPYQPNFAPPISNPLEVSDDPSFVAAPGRGNPATLGGYGSVGFPMIVVPMGFGTQGLPMGLAFMGKPYDDARIIGLAYDYEQATKMRRPPPLLPDLLTHSTEELG